MLEALAGAVVSCAREVGVVVEIGGAYVTPPDKGMWVTHCAKMVIAQ